MKGREVATLVGAVILIALLLNPLGGAMTGGGMMGGGMMGAGTMGGGYGFGGTGIAQSIVTLLFWLLLLGGTVLLVSKLLGNKDSASDRTGSARPLDILRERYARGEISREQYERMRHDLDA